MKSISVKFFNIDYNTNRLIYLFQSRKFESMDFDELFWMISQLNEYQYFFLLNNVILDIETTKKNLNLFFPFQYSINVGIGTMNDPILTGVKFNYNNSFEHYFQLINNLQPEIGIFELLHFNEKLRTELFPLMYELPEKLNHIDTIKPIYEKTALEHVCKPYNSVEELPSECIGEKNSLITVITNDFQNSYAIDHLEFSLTIIFFEENLKKLKERFLKLHLSTNSYNYLGVSLFPIIHGLNAWKQFVITTISNEKAITSREKQRLYFIESLDSLRLITGQRYVKIDFNIYDLDKLNRWLKDLNVKSLELTKPPLAENNFDLTISDSKLEILYKNLKKSEFIDRSKTNFNDFVNVLKLNWNEHDSIIYLNMDHPHTKMFFDKFNSTFNIKLSFQKIEFSRKIENKNGVIKASSLYSSNSRNKTYSTLRNSDLIIELFENLNK